MIDEQNFFHQPVKSYLRTYKNRKTATGHGDDYTSSCLSDYNYFNKYYKVTGIVSKRQTLDTDLKAIQQTDFTGNLTRAGNANTTIFFIIKKLEETILDFSQAVVKVL